MEIEVFKRVEKVKVVVMIHDAKVLIITDSNQLRRANSNSFTNVHQRGAGTRERGGAKVSRRLAHTGFVV